MMPGERASVCDGMRRGCIHEFLFGRTRRDYPKQSCLCCMCSHTQMKIISVHCVGRS